MLLDTVAWVPVGFGIGQVLQHHLVAAIVAFSLAAVLWLVAEGIQRRQG